MYQVFEIVVLFGISRLSYLRLKRIKEQREKYLNGEYWVPNISGNPKEDRKLAYEGDIFMAKSSIVLSSLMGIIQLWILTKYLF